MRFSSSFDFLTRINVQLVLFVDFALIAASAHSHANDLCICPVASCRLRAFLKQLL